MINKIIKHPHFLPFILFTFIFTVYFSSAVGLYNSVDTPQYFTTEALIKNKDINIKTFSSDPHFFVYPDVYEHRGKLLSLRGVVYSFLVIPLHLLANITKNLFNINNFPTVVRSPNFNYELAITSFSSIFTIIGLFSLFKLIVKISKNKMLAAMCIVLIAFGSYMWKYSTLYSRQSVVVLILGAYLYILYLFLKSKKLFWLALLLTIFALAYGIDMLLFIPLFLFNVMFLIYVLFNKILNFNKILISSLFPILIILIFFYLNYINYGNILSNQIINLPINKEKVTNQELFSTPVFPTIYHVLFGFGKISSESFKNHEIYERDYNSALSLYYAKKYNFFGVFTISPFLIFGMCFFILKINNKKHQQIIKTLIFFSFFTFIIGIILNTKITGFWGGNQYDIRYFYPYVILLGLPLSLSLKEIIKIKNKRFKNSVMIMFVILSAFSLVMGWLGVISMYRPALTGERKIWMDIFNLKTQLFRHSFKEYLDATFMNRENAWIAVALSIIGYIIFRFLTFLFQKIKTSSKRIRVV